MEHMFLAMIADGKTAALWGEGKKAAKMHALLDGSSFDGF